MEFDLTPVKFCGLCIKGTTEKENTALKLYFISYLKIILLTIVVFVY